jgi:MFS transporter, ACS family, tartrate transporter
MFTVKPSDIQEQDVLVALSVEATIGQSALRKANLRLIPLIAIDYAIAYMNRINISFAALQMNRDLHFSASIYGFGAGLFFLSYTACEVPSNLMLFRFGARRWIARIMVTWGLLAIGMMFVKTPLQFYVMRFLLGMAEAGFFPGILFYLTQWFPAKTRARTVSGFYVSIPLSSVIMGVLAGALLNLQGRLGLAGWQWLFLLEGLPAILLSIIFLIYLPSNPAEANWLTSDERTWILNQLKSENSTVMSDPSGGLGRALLDTRVWQVGLFFLCVLGCSYAQTFSAPTIIQNITALSTTSVGFVVAIMGLLSAVAMVLNGLHSDRTGERYLHVVVPCLLMAAGYVVCGFSVAPLVAIPAFAIGVIGQFALQGPIWSIASGFLKGKSAAAGIAAMNTIGIVGGFLGPYWMGRARDLTSDYQHGLLTLAIPSLAAAALMIFMRNSTQRSQLSLGRGVAPGELRAEP